MRKTLPPCVKSPSSRASSKHLSAGPPLRDMWQATDTHSIDSRGGKHAHSVRPTTSGPAVELDLHTSCLLYTSDAADDTPCVDL
eukprot:7141978-Pyramimonas_sp.AAC.1